MARCVDGQLVFRWIQDDTTSGWIDVLVNRSVQTDWGTDSRKCTSRLALEWNSSISSHRLKWILHTWIVWKLRNGLLDRAPILSILPVPTKASCVHFEKSVRAYRVSLWIIKLIRGIKWELTSQFLKIKKKSVNSLNPDDVMHIFGTPNSLFFS